MISNVNVVSRKPRRIFEEWTKNRICRDCLVLLVHICQMIIKHKGHLHLLLTVLVINVSSAFAV